MSSEHNHIEHLVDSAEAKKTFFNIHFLEAFAPIFLATFISFVAIKIVGGPDNLPNWFNWAMFIIFTVGISFSLVVAQKRHLVGAYGETIVVLIPTYVWLLGGKFIAQEIMLDVSMAVMALGVLFAFGSVLPFYIFKKNRERARWNSQILLRICFVCATTTATFIISLIMLNWADKTMGLAPLSVNAETGEPANDYSATTWVIFIALVTIISAAALVMIGLTHGEGEKHESEIKKILRKIINVFSFKKNAHSEVHIEHHVVGHNEHHEDFVVTRPKGYKKLTKKSAKKGKYVNKKLIKSEGIVEKIKKKHLRDRE